MLVPYISIRIEKIINAKTDGTAVIVYELLLIDVSSNNCSSSFVIAFTAELNSRFGRIWIARSTISII